MRTKKTTPKTSGESPSPVTKRPRLRKRRGGHHKYQDKILNERRGLITLSEEPSMAFKPKSFSGNAPRIRGAKIRNSKRWIGGFSAPVTALNFPYIDRLGRFTGQTLFRWSCDPRQFVASVVATVASRLHNRCVYYNSMAVANKCSDLIVRASYYYAVTKNNYFVDRVLFFLKTNLEKNKNQFARLVHGFTLKTDANKRFVYGHVCSQTQWLLFRAERPRGKSVIEGKISPVLNRTGGVSSHYISGIVEDLAIAMSSMNTVSAKGPLYV